MSTIKKIAKIYLSKMVDLEKFVMVKQGAEARLYNGSFLGQEVVIKERFSKKYRHPDLDTQLTKDRHKAEARSLLKCKQVVNSSQFQQPLFQILKNLQFL